MKIIAYMASAICTIGMITLVSDLFIGTIMMCTGVVTGIILSIIDTIKL